MGGWDDKLNKDKVTKFVIIIDRYEDGSYITKYLSITECVSQGKAEQES